MSTTAALAPRSPLRPLSVAAAALLFAAPALAQPCQPQWTQPGNGLGNAVFGMHVHAGRPHPGAQFTSPIGPA